MTILTDPRFGTPLRHLGRMVSARPADICEMGDEDGCPNPPAYWLTAPASFTIPLMVCEAHAADEVRYFGTPMPTTMAAEAAAAGFTERYTDADGNVDYRRPLGV